MPKISLHNATLLYVAGQVRMALGDREAGLRLISSAAQQNDQLVVSTASSSNQKISTVNSTSPKCAKTAAVPVSGHSKFVVYSRSAEPSPASLASLARLENVDFTSPQFDKAKFASEMRQAAELRTAAMREENRHTMARVRADLERRGIPMPPNAFAMGAPEAPVPPVTIP